MSERTVTHAIECDAQPNIVLRILTDASRIPEWAPAFADRVERNDETAWRATKNGNDFILEVVVGPSSGTVDYLREIAPGRKGGAFLRVLPRPVGGCVVVMTLPVSADQSRDDVTAVLKHELESLVKLSI
jgi:hypothetical protein